MPDTGEIFNVRFYKYERQVEKVHRPTTGYRLFY
jgi:hypothetical protein